MTTPATRTAQPYDPESVDDSFGWIWTDIDGDGKRWNLIATFYDEDGDLWTRFIEPEDPEALLELADFFRGRPYLPMLQPDCSTDAEWLVFAITAAGLTMQYSGTGEPDADIVVKLLGAGKEQGAA